MGHKPEPRKLPTMSIFWSDTRKLLTYKERRALEFQATVVSVTPMEVLLEIATGKGKETRKVCIVGVFDPLAPVPPSPK
jgi:hypothetical protein